MNISKETNNESCTLTLSDKTSIYDATSLQHELLTAFEACSSITVDLSQVTACDSSIIQLLISASKSAAAKHIDYKINKPSGTAAAITTHLGFDWQDIVKH